ncbi:MAG: hypothetical protein LH481_09565 [Burkholderiales bacterium]|nr:hypothetical protein [Burkholderiales bacterium]
MRTALVLTLLFNLLGLSLSGYAQGLIRDPLEIEFCGYTSFDTPEFVVVYNRYEKQRIALGFIHVCDEVLQRNNFQKEIKPWLEISSSLGFVPVDLRSTPFAQFELIGGVLNATIPGFAFLARTDHATRVFRSAEGLIISLEEWDLSIVGGGTSEVYRSPDVMVKGWPGYWSIEQAKSGKAYSILTWQGATRKFLLTINTNLKLTGEQPAFLRLAESIPPGNPIGSKKPAVTVMGTPGVLSKRPIPDHPDF